MTSTLPSSRRSLFVLLALAACQVPQPGAPPAPGTTEMQASAVTTLLGVHRLGGVFRSRQAGGGPLRVQRPDLRGREDRPHLLLRQPDRHHAHPVRRPARRGEQLLDRGLLGHRPRSQLPGHAAHLRALHPRHGDQRRERHSRSPTATPPTTVPSRPAAPTTAASATGVLSRVVDTGTYPRRPPPTTVLVTEWPQQFPGHSVQHLTFGPDGILYASAGDGAASQRRLDTRHQVGHPGQPDQRSGRLARRRAARAEPAPARR